MNHSLLAACAVLSLISGGLAQGQVVELKNDSAPIPPRAGVNFPAAVSVGFGAGEEALAVFAVPPGTTFPLQVSRLGILWYSQLAALLGSSYAGTQTLQEGFKFYAGNSPDPRTMSLVTITNPPQLTDGFFNIFDLAAEFVTIDTPVSYIAASLQFDAQLTSGDYTNQAPNGSIAAASVCYDQTSGDPDRNWIFTPTPTSTSTGMQSGWIKYRDLRGANGALPSGWDLVLRIYIEPYSAPCAVDINADGVVDGSDFTAFINSFSLGDPAVDAAADFNRDGTIDGSDFVGFINAFGAGC